MSELSICPHCGSSISSDANFCPRCGTDLRSEGAEQPSSSPTKNDDSPATTSPQPTKDQPGVRQSPAENVGSRTSPVSMGADKSDEPDKVDLFPPLSGLLDPVGVSGEWRDEILAGAERRSASVLDADELRRIRYRMLQEPTLMALVQPMPPTHGIYRVRWIFGLLILTLLIPFFLSASGPTTSQQIWKSADAAYAKIKGTTSSNVLVVWAYDAATAGEIDALMLPVLRQLGQQKNTFEVVSLLPGGLATAQRLLNEANASSDEKQNAVQQEMQMRAMHFLPGGTAALPLIAATVCAKEGCGHQPLLDFVYCSTQCDFGLVIVAAAQAEDVQRWLEIVAPTMVGSPVIAVTSGAADLPLLPYWHSGQLDGLVGGFDGVAEYVKNNPQILADAEWTARWQSLYQLRWGHFALLIVIFLGNLVALGTVRDEG